MDCLFCHKPLTSIRQKFCCLSHKGFYHRYKNNYPDGFSVDEWKLLTNKSKRGRKPLPDDKKKYRIQIPIHRKDVELYEKITNPKKFFLEELNVFLLCGGEEVSNIIKNKNALIHDRDNNYINYTLYVSFEILNKLNKISSDQMRTKRNLLVIFSFYALTR